MQGLSYRPVLSFGQYVVCELYAWDVEHFHQPVLGRCVYPLPARSVLPVSLDDLPQLFPGDLQYTFQRHECALVFDVSVGQLLPVGLANIRELHRWHVQ